MGARSAARHLPDPNRQRRQRGGLHHEDRDVLNVAHADALHAASAGLLGDEDRRRLLAVARTAIIWSAVAGQLVTRVGVKPVLVVGMTMLTAGLLFFTQVSV